MRTVATILTILVTLASSGAILLAIDEPVLKGWIRATLVSDPDIFTATYQFFLLTMIGAAITYLFKLLSDLRAERKIRASLLMEMDQELGKCYRESKRVKRSLRTEDIGNDDGIIMSQEAYIRIMEDLEDVQLSVEKLRETAKTSTHLFTMPRRDRIVFCLHYVARYLQEVFEDFEQRRYSEEAEHRILLGGNARATRNFVGKNRNSIENPMSGNDKQLVQIFDHLAKLVDRYPKGNRDGKVALYCLQYVSLEIRVALEVL